MKDSLLLGMCLRWRKLCPFPVALFSGPSAPNFSPKGSAPGRSRRWLANGLFLWGCFLFPRSLPPFFSRPPPSPLSRIRREPPRPLRVARSGEHFKASLARRLEEVYRLPLSSQASCSLRRPLGRGGGALRFGFLAIFKDMSLGWPGMVAQQLSRPLSFFLSHSQQGNFNTA